MPKQRNFDDAKAKTFGSSIVKQVEYPKNTLFIKHQHLQSLAL
jgi:hypothetical protein